MLHMLKGEPLKKEGDSAINVRVADAESAGTKSSYQGLYTYLSYTDIESVQEWEHDWASYGTEDYAMPSMASLMNYSDVSSNINDAMIGELGEIDRKSR